MIPEDLIKVKEQQITFIKNGITYGLIFDVQGFDQDESTLISRYIVSKYNKKRRLLRFMIFK